MNHQYYSQRNGSNPNLDGLPLSDTIDLFLRVYNQLESEGYFTQAFGYWCVDAEHVDGLVKDVELEMLLSIRKKNLWPISQYAESYTEDDFLDVIEFLYQHVSKPIDGTMHSYGECGMHWETFNKKDGQVLFLERINLVLGYYKNKYELDISGQVLSKPEKGFEQIFKADVPSEDHNIVDRINVATTQFRRHGSTIDDRRQAVRDLADVLEYLKPKVKQLLSKKDEQDLFNIANNFGVRHHNNKQKTSYDSAIWLSWMFYFYLSTIHVVLRKIGHDNNPKT
ncbi:hypothetical protein CRG86_005700 [Photobacterium leiognathi]|nr:hypothetical protein CRG86_005700 [Photobacterium leiognathi]